MDVTLDVIFACKFFSDVILHVISDMHGERARYARRKFDMNFTYMTPITSRFCMDVTLDVNLQGSTLIPNLRVESKDFRVRHDISPIMHHASCIQQSFSQIRSHARSY